MAVDNVARALAAKAIAGGGAGSSSGSGVQVQADWNVNDESNPSFIKNKPFSDNSTVVFRRDSLDEYQVNYGDDDGKYFPDIHFELEQNELTLVDGEIYHVKCSSDQGTVEHTGKARNIGGVVIAGDRLSEDGTFSPNGVIDIVVTEIYDEANPSYIDISFHNLIVVDTPDTVPTLTNVSISIEKLVTKKIPSKFIELPDQVQADWNTADESDPSFIKNKPFGADVIFRKDSLDEYQHFIGSIGSVWIPAIQLGMAPNMLTLVDGETYHVKCSSDQGTVEYTGKAKLFNGGLVLGDCYLEDGSTNYDNFTVDIWVGETYENPSYIEIAFKDLKANTEDTVPTLTNVSIIIEKGAIKKIPSKFIELPENLEQVQADWNTTDETNISFIKNKPNIPPVYMIYKSKYENGDYSQDFKKELYDAIPKGITMYYVDDSKSSYETDSGGTIYYPITAIHTYINCGEEVNIKCTYTSWSWDNNNSKYVSTVKFISFVFHKSTSL